MHSSDRKIKRINICPVRNLDNFGVPEQIAPMRAPSNYPTHVFRLKPPTGP